MCRPAAAQLAHGREGARLETVEQLFRYGKGNGVPGVVGTWWAAYNGVTEYPAHARPRSTEESRAESLTFGTAAATNARALKTALLMARVTVTE